MPEEENNCTGFFAIIVCDFGTRALVSMKRMKSFPGAILGPKLPVFFAKLRNEYYLYEWEEYTHNMEMYVYIYYAPK